MYRFTSGGLERHDARILRAAAALGLLVVLPGLLHDGLTSTATIYLGIAALVVSTSLVASRHARPDPLRVHELGSWLLTRGILYALLQAPLFAVLVGYFFGYVSYPVGAFAVLVSAAILPAWVAWRKQASQDPAEPVHQLTRYARAAIVPVAIFSLVRIPTFFLFGIAYWQPWYAFGNALTGAPLNQYGSLAAGAILYALQGFALVAGFYVLFQRHTLLAAVLYLCAWDSGLYSYAFPLVRLGMDTTPVWHLNGVFAHLCLAIAAWTMSTLWGGFWHRLSATARVATATALAGVLIAPFAFAAYQATVWQFPLQHAIDQAVFERPGLVSLGEAPRVSVDGQDAHYIYSLRFGPRLYRTWAGASRVLEADDLRVTGRLLRAGMTIAWCSSAVVHLAGPPLSRDPLAYRSALEDNTSIPVTCVGPDTRIDTQPAIDVQWAISTDLVGDREREHLEIRGDQLADITAE
jgi:hypothetical protein